MNILRVKIQPYLAKLYMAMVVTAYYGLFRIGEIALSSYAIKYRDVSWSKRKRKFLFVLRSSKTHTRNSKPQLVKTEGKTSRYCPYEILTSYVEARGQILLDKEELFFIFRDHTPVQTQHFRAVLKKTIRSIGLNKEHYYA